MIVLINMESIYSYDQNGRLTTSYNLDLSLSLSLDPELIFSPSVLALNSDFPFYDGFLGSVHLGNAQSLELCLLLSLALRRLGNS